MLNADELHVLALSRCVFVASARSTGGAYTYHDGELTSFAHRGPQELRV